MTIPYLVVSDLHFHKWSAFATASEGQVNSRLLIQINELIRAAQELKKRGGSVMIVAGDVMHVRGSMDPEVWNTVFSAFVIITGLGIKIYAIPGNHDLASRETTELGNAIQTLASVDGIEVITKPTRMTGILPLGQQIAFLPWISSKDKLREEAQKFKGNENTDLIMHVGIDGVLRGVPDAGLSSEEVADWGFKRVFAGDYHNHKVMEEGKVISIGALTHQQWGDIGTKAGHLFVYPDRVEYSASHAPSFVEITGETDPDDIPLIVDKNYVRVRGKTMTDAEVNEFRQSLLDMGAAGVSFQIVKDSVVARGPSVIGKAATLDESIGKFIDGLEGIDVAAVKHECADILNTVRSIAA